MERRQRYLALLASFLLTCVAIACVAITCFLYRRRSREAALVRRSRDRAQLDLQLLSHQVQAAGGEAWAGVAGRSTCYLGAPPSSLPPPSLPPAPPSSASGKSAGGQSAASGASTNSEIEALRSMGSGLAPTTMPTDGRMAPAPLLLATPGSGSPEPNVQLCSTTDIEERYSQQFDEASVYPPLPQFHGQATGAKLGEAERAKLLVGADSGGRLVFTGTGEPLGLTATSQETLIFVALASGAIYASPCDDHAIYHHTLAGNAPVVAAGEIVVSAGRPLSINNRSGHYRPAPECLQLAVSLLRSKGVRIRAPCHELHVDATGDPMPQRRASAGQGAAASEGGKEAAEGGIDEEPSSSNSDSDPTPPSVEPLRAGQGGAEMAVAASTSESFPSTTEAGSEAASTAGKRPRAKGEGEAEAEKVARQLTDGSVEAVLREARASRLSVVDQYLLPMIHQGLFPSQQATTPPPTLPPLAAAPPGTTPRSDAVLDSPSRVGLTAGAGLASAAVVHSCRAQCLA